MGKRRVRLYDKDFKEEDFNDLRQGDVIVCPGEHGDNYLIVFGVLKGEVVGQFTSCLGATKRISAKDIADACKL